MIWVLTPDIDFQPFSDSNGDGSGDGFDYDSEYGQSDLYWGAGWGHFYGEKGVPPMLECAP